MLKEMGKGYQRFLLYSEWGYRQGISQGDRKAKEPP